MRETIQATYKFIVGLYVSGILPQFPEYNDLNEILKQDHKLPTDLLAPSKSCKPFLSARFYERFEKLYNCYPPEPLNFSHFDYNSDFTFVNPVLVIQDAKNHYDKAKEALFAYRSALQSSKTPSELPASSETLTELLRYCISSMLLLNKTLNSPDIQSFSSYEDVKKGDNTNTLEARIVIERRKDARVFLPQIVLSDKKG